MKVPLKPITCVAAQACSQTLKRRQLAAANAPSRLTEVARRLQGCLARCPGTCRLRMLGSRAPRAYHMGCHNISALQISGRKQGNNLKTYLMQGTPLLLASANQHTDTPFSMHGVLLLGFWHMRGGRADLLWKIDVRGNVAWACVNCPSVTSLALQAAKFLGRQPLVEALRQGLLAGDGVRLRFVLACCDRIEAMGTG